MGAKHKFRQWFDYYMEFSDKITENHIFAYASQASFFVIISAVPFIIIVLNILRLFMPVTPDYFFTFIDEFLPVQIRALAEHFIIDFYANINISLVSVTSVFLVWTASRGVKAISYGLRMVFDTNDKGGYIIMSFWSLIYTVVFMVSIVVSVGLLLFGKYLANLITNYIPAARAITDLVLNLRYIVLLIFLTFVFMSAYKFLGKSKMKFRKHFVGAVLSAAFWLIFSASYSFYISYISNFSYIYGSLTAIIFLMLWLWFCMISLLFGAEVNRWLYEHNISAFSLMKKCFCRKKSKKDKSLAKK